MVTRRPATLRNVLSIAVVVVALLVIIAAVSLVIATSVRQSTREEIAASIESVRTIEEAEVSLLLHLRARTPAERHELEIQVRSLMDEAALYMMTPAEQAAFEEARTEVEQYLELTQAPASSPDELRAAETQAIGALERLVDIDVATARAAQEHALKLSRIATIAAILFGIAIIIATGGLVWWLRRRVIQPLFALADTMKRFGEGERELRAKEEGATELRDMTARFNEMADGLAARRQAQIAFLGGVAHDLRNPLSALKLALELVGPDQPLPAEPQLRRTIGMISRQIAQLDRMVGDFLDMAKIEAGELELHLEPHDIGEIVRSSLELFDTATRARMRETLPDHPLLVSCDAVRMGQAVTNLLSNAVKYSPSEAPIEIRVVEKPSEVSIEVTDHGSGIARDELQHIFKPFQRGSTAKVDVPGTGLGLFNVRRIMRAHHGEIDVESTVGEGSTFRLHLARIPASELPATTATRAYRER